MTKRQRTRIEILAELDRLWKNADETIRNLQPLKGHPQVDPMIVKNEGYKLALEGVNSFINSQRS